MSLFISRIFWHEMEVFAPNYERAMHFGRDDGASKNPTTNRDLTSKWAFFICDESQRYVLKIDGHSALFEGHMVVTDICALDSSLWGFEA